MKIIAISNQKGGVTKTCTALHLGVALAMQGKKVVLIDLDPQGDLTTSMGWPDGDSISVTIATKLEDVIHERNSDSFEGILQHEEGVDLIPANLELSALELSLVNAMSRETTLRTYLEQIKDRYDYCILDCAPSLGMITLNALAAADSVIIPVAAQYLPAKGMTQLLKTVGRVKKYINPQLKVEGILLTLVDNRTNLSKSTIEIIENTFGAHIKIYKTTIPVNVKAAECASKGISIYKYAPSSPATKAYLNFTKEVLKDHEKNRLRTDRVR